MSLPWSSKGFKVTPVSADEFLIIDSADANPATQNKRVTIGSLPTGSSSPLTTKGDVYTFDTADARLPVGADGQILSANSVQPTGLEWIVAPSGSDTPWTEDHDAASFNLLNLGYLESNAAIPATSGAIRLGDTEIISWRDQLNTFNTGLQADNVALVSIGFLDLDFTSMTGTIDFGDATDALFSSALVEVNELDVITQIDLGTSAPILNGFYIELDNAGTSLYADDGAIRLTEDSEIAWRNAADDDNLLMYASGDELNIESFTGIVFDGSGTVDFSSATEMDMSGGLVRAATLETDLIRTTGAFSSVGRIRLENLDIIGWRNAADTGDITFQVDGSDQFLFNSQLNVGSNLIKNVLTPVDGTDAANKTYVDDAISGLSWKTPAVVATTGNITLSGEQNIDGIVTSTSRVLVKDQTSASENGVYLSDAAAWSRTTDADTEDDLLNMSIFIQQGTANADTSWVLTTDAPIIVDTTPLLYVQVSGGFVSPLTTKGDIFGYDTGNNRIPVGTDGQILTANSAVALGVEWTTVSDTPWTVNHDAAGFNLINLAVLESNATNVGTVGVIRLGDNENIVWRNAANDEDREINSNDDSLEFIGWEDLSGGDFTTIDFSGATMDLDSLNMNGTIDMSNNTIIQIGGLSIDDGIRITFNPNATNAGLNVGAQADPDPTSPVNGDIYYNSTNNKFRVYENSSWIDMTGGSGSQTPWTSNIDAAGFALLDANYVEVGSSLATSYASVGQIRLPAEGAIAWRNDADDADFQIYSTSDELTIEGWENIVIPTADVQIDLGNASVSGIENFEVGGGPSGSIDFGDTPVFSMSTLQYTASNLDFAFSMGNLDIISWDKTGGVGYGSIGSNASDEVVIGFSATNPGAVVPEYTFTETTADFKNNALKAIAAPVDGTDAANKTYVDNLVNGLAWKNPAVVATTGNITLSGNQTIDGILTINGDRVLVKDQTSGQFNGLYNADAGAWTRTTDADSESDLLNMSVYISQGSTQADTSWVLTTDAPIVVDTTVLNYAQVGAGAGNPLTTKGDIFGYDTANNRIPVGTDGQVLTANSAVALGVDWQAPAGDVTGPSGGVVDGEFAVYDSTTGKIIKGNAVKATLSNAGVPTWPRTINFTSNSVTVPAGSVGYIVNFINEMYTNASSGHRWFVNNVQQATMSSSTLALANLNFIIGTAYTQLDSISSPASTGLATRGRLFLDLDNSNHLTIQRNGVEFDLEAGGGDVTGPGSSTDNGIARFDGVTGKLLQNSGVTIDDNNTTSHPGPIVLTAQGTVPPGTETYFREVSNDLIVNVASAQAVDFNFGTTTRVTFTSSGIDLLTNTLAQAVIDSTSILNGTQVQTAGLSYSNGIKQTFNPSTSNAGLNVGGETLDPSAPANGDIYYNSTANELRARINGAWVALGVGTEVVTWTQDHNAARFNLENTGVIDFNINGAISLPAVTQPYMTYDDELAPEAMVINWPSGDELRLHVNGVEEYTFSSSLFLGNNNILRGFTQIEAQATLGNAFVTIENTTSSPANGTLCGTLRFVADRLGASAFDYGKIVTEIVDNSAGSADGEMKLMVGNNNTENVEYITLNETGTQTVHFKKNLQDFAMDPTSGTAQINGLEGLVFTDDATILGGSNNFIQKHTDNMIYNVETGDGHLFTINGTTEFSMSSTTLDVNGNDVDNIQNLVHDISTSGTDIDFNEDEIQTISISANTVFTTTNRAAGRSKVLKITTDGTLRTLTFPGWDWTSTIPADQAANKNGYLTLTCFDTTDASIVASYLVGSL